MMASNRKLAEILDFLLKLLAFSGLLYIGIVFLDLSLLQGAIASQVSNILALFGIESVPRGAIMHFGEFSVIVSRDSTGWKSLLFLAALILSSRSSDMGKFLGLSLLLPAVYLLNLMRIAVTSYSAFYGVEAFNFFHDVFWQLGMVVGVIVLWLVWLRFFREL